MPQTVAAAVPAVELSKLAAPSAANEIAAILLPSCMRAPKGSVQLLPVGDMSSTKARKRRSSSRMLRNNCSMTPDPSPPGVAPWNRSALPPGASNPSVVCT